MYRYLYINICYILKGHFKEKEKSILHKDNIDILKMKCEKSRTQPL